MRGYRFTKPPRICIRLDNLALVPANLLQYKEQWQAIANSHPTGSVLIVLPRTEGTHRQALEKMAITLQAGHQVTTVSAEQFVGV